MVLAAQRAVSEFAQAVKALYAYYDNQEEAQAVLDTLTALMNNLEVATQRLIARQDLFSAQSNPALGSIERDFINAKKWLQTNDRTLRAQPTQAASNLKALDDKLTKAFASKMGIAIFSALQGTRASEMQVQTSSDGTATNLEAVCRETSKEGISEAISALKEEAYMASGGGRSREFGFTSGEAEKLISQLVDRLSEQERLKEEEVNFVPYLPAIARPASRTPDPPAPYQSDAPDTTGLAVPYTPVPLHRSMSINSAFMPAGSASRASSPEDEPEVAPISRPTSSLSKATTPPTLSTKPSDRPSRNKGKFPEGSIIFNPKDPNSEKDLIDPVLANDGLIHDRWSLISGKHENLLDPNEPLVILGAVVQLREALFTKFPARRQEFQQLRDTYKQETLQLLETTEMTSFPDLINQLSHILLWETNSISLRVRRAILLYRLRDLAAAEADLTKAIDLSLKIVSGQNGTPQADLDALRIRALVREELHDYEECLHDVENVLARSPHDILCLSLRSAIRANQGNLIGAQNDLTRTNLAITHGNAFLSHLGDRDVHLEYCARGWAYMNLRDYESARADFEYSLSLRDSPEPYTLASRGLALLRYELESGGGLDPTARQHAMKYLNQSIEMHKKFGQVRLNDVTASAGKSTSGMNAIELDAAGWPRSAFPAFFLRGAAYYALGESQKALKDFQKGLALKPAEVKDTGPFCAALADIKFETGDKKGANHLLDKAIALDPGNRFAYNKAREDYDL